MQILPTIIVLRDYSRTVKLVLGGGRDATTRNFQFEYLKILPQFLDIHLTFIWFDIILFFL